MVKTATYKGGCRPYLRWRAKNGKNGIIRVAPHNKTVRSRLKKRLLGENVALLTVIVRKVKLFSWKNFIPPPSPRLPSVLQGMVLTQARARGLQERWRSTPPRVTRNSACGPTRLNPRPVMSGQGGGTIGGWVGWGRIG